jgi:transposase
MLRDANPNSFSAIYVVCGYTDMRYSIDSLAAIIESKYHLPLFKPNTLFLFCGKRNNKIKGLLWEGDGFLLLTKRIEDGSFSWPRNSTEARMLSPIQFEWLMKGFPIDPKIRLTNPEKSA